MALPKHNTGVRYYTSIDDHINNKTYVLETPLYYSDIPAIIEEGEMLPIYDNIDPHATGISRYTIAGMIDMRAKGVPFTICNRRDIVDIKQHLDMYLIALYEHKGRPTVDAYLSKCAVFQKEITNAFNKFIKSKKSASMLVERKNIFEQILSGQRLASDIAERYFNVAPNK